jgi:hypothetical protein
MSVCDATCQLPRIQKKIHEYIYTNIFFQKTLLPDVVFLTFGVLSQVSRGSEALTGIFGLGVKKILKTLGGEQYDTRRSKFRKGTLVFS